MYQQTESKEQLGAPGTLIKQPFDPSADIDGRNVGLPPHAESSPARIRSKPLIFGFHVAWDPGSFRSLKANSQNLTHVLAEWLILKNGRGDLTDTVEPDVVAWSQQSRVPILAVLTNYRDGNWQSADLHRVLRTPESRHRTVASLVAVVDRYQLGGVNLDLEQVPVGDRDQLTDFVRELHNLLQQRGLLLTQDVPTDDANVAAYDLPVLAQLNDYVIPMVYDEHYSTGAPGPLASMPWLREQLTHVLSTIPPEKTVVGLGNYGYDWAIGSARAGVEVGFSEVLSRANQYHGKLVWNSGLLSPSLRYSKSGVSHEVWFLDAATALNSVREVQKSGFAGVSFWRLGAEDPQLWKLFRDRQWPAADLDVNSLSVLPAIESVRQYGRGEAIRVTSTRAAGERRVWKQGDEFHERYVRNPSGDVVGGMGISGTRYVTLTFDDGPDPRYTPRILDILRDKNVSATFFVVGTNAADSGALLKRMYAEGHSIGNHTFSHINETQTSDAKLAVELGLTQRLIEHFTGHSTTLYRSPYNADSDPRTPQAIQSVLRPQNLGYLTVGERIDPRDWEGKTADEIVAKAVEDRSLGSIILLHDGGGDRSPTVDALPALIDALRARGDELVSLETLLSRGRDDLMPEVAGTERVWATVEGSLVSAVSQVKTGVGYLFTFAIAVTALRSLLYLVLAVAQKIRSARIRRRQTIYQPPVSVMIAAYNEEKVIATTIRAVLASDYPQFEVLVLDDGSKDETLGVLYSEFGRDRRVRILHQANAGKSAALNQLTKEARYDILVALDADTQLLPDTIGKLSRHFQTENVAAVSGNVRVGNRKGWLARFQSIEYICGFNLDRRALDLLNAVAVVPGALGAWRRSVVVAAGGYPHDTVAEDTDLTLAIRRQGYRICYEEEAVAYTEVPETIPVLLRQRLRWAFGTLQAAWKHRDTTFVPAYGTMAFVTMPSIWLHNILLAMISPVAETALILSLLFGNLRSALLYYAALFTLDLVASMGAYALERCNPADLLLLPLQRLLYSQLMLFVVCKSLVNAVGGRLMGWGAQVRTATVILTPQIPRVPARTNQESPATAEYAHAER